MSRPAFLAGAFCGVGILAVIVVLKLMWDYVLTPAYDTSRPWLVPAAIVATVTVVVGTGVTIVRHRRELRQDGWLGPRS